MRGHSMSLRRVAEELPVLFLVVGEFVLDLAVCIQNLGGKQVPMLIAHRGGSAFQVNEDPAVLFGPAKGILKTRIGLRLARSQGQGQRKQQEEDRKSSTTHLAIIRTLNAKKLTAHVKAAG